MNKTRTIIIDGIEIQTSLTGVEIANLTQKNKELEQQVKNQKETIDKAIEYIKEMFDTGFYNDDYYLGKLNQILQNKEVSE